MMHIPDRRHYDANSCVTVRSAKMMLQVTNLMSDSSQVDVLAPQSSASESLHHQTALRVLCKFKAPVGGISIKQHLEVNVIPLVFQLTARFYTAMMQFFFPDKVDDGDDDDNVDDILGKIICYSFFSPSTTPDT